MHLPHPHLSAGSLLRPAARRHLDVGILMPPRFGTPEALPLHRQVVDAIEIALPTEFFTAAPFARLAVYLRCTTPVEAAGPPSPLLLEKGWLEITWPFDCLPLSRSRTGERDARLQILIADALLFVAKRFTLPCDSLRRARHGALARLLKHRRER